MQNQMRLSSQGSTIFASGRLQIAFEIEIPFAFLSDGTRVVLA